MFSEILVFYSMKDILVKKGHFLFRLYNCFVVYVFYLTDVIWFLSAKILKKNSPVLGEKPVNKKVVVLYISRVCHLLLAAFNELW